MHIRVHAIDSKGRRDYRSQDELEFSVEGDAKIVAVSNGDMLSDELNAVNTRSLYNGSAMVLLRAGKTAGQVVITVKPKGSKLKPQRIKLNTTASEILPTM